MSATGDLVVLEKTNLVYNYTTTIGRNAQKKTVAAQDNNVKVLYSVNNKTGAVTVYRDDGRNLSGQTTTSLQGLELAVWSPTRGGGGEWYAVGQSGQTIPTKAAVDPTWDQLAGDSFTTGLTNGDRLIKLVGHDVNELPPEDRKSVTGVPGVLPVETLDEDAGTEGSKNENDSKPTAASGLNPEDDPARVREGSFGVMRYPNELPLNVSDLIQFEVVEYKSLAQSRRQGSNTNQVQNPSAADAISPTLRRLKTDSKGTINLAIQPPVTDTNGVNWTDTGINLVDLGLAAGSLGFIQGGVGGAEDVLKAVGNRVRGDQKNIQEGLATYFAQKASQTSNLLSRLTGSVLNPNLETLFEGPRTRSFNYQFQFTPRDEKEAVMVRKIIRTFKEAMAVKRTRSLGFLKAPYVFNIRYLYKVADPRDAADPDKGTDHPYIGRVKGPCALKDMQTDYTPEGSYMTYEGGKDGGSMVKYTITLVFQELDPIYADDYLTLGENSIGY